MPRGETKHLGAHQYKQQWVCQPTSSARLPLVLRSELLEIAKWADKQPDPQEALRSILDSLKYNKCPRAAVNSRERGTTQT